ncbi:CtrA inhibitor SciP [Sphingosinicella rhizophila]|uniref:DUF1153 domain-containing protein n=1 Tax=Sphingosinicella rhizophila TaxID=3050082 RepID=A0ABU3Q1Z3_9SPHN|nr:DUF1153 domain-containing protein [Sphingosinicella sp. GR2756]MDT9597444.1 DUF1153 domain-containing protein [Sphingosinicella sp. GR2756]
MARHYQTQQDNRPHPLGGPITLANLPPPDTTRWVARRKAQVVAAVQAGLLTIEEALIRYRLSLEEFNSWQKALYRHGVRGLQTTHLQIFKLADRKRKKGESSRKNARSWGHRHV